jgi:putative chitinase
MSYVDFQHGLYSYRLTDELVCGGATRGTPVSAGFATMILRSALSGPLPILATRIRAAFPEFDGGRAAPPTILQGSLADRIGVLIKQGRLALIIYAPAAMGALLAASPLPAGANDVTADELRAIMPNAGTRADDYVDALNAAMTAHGIETPERRAAFLAQIAVESGDLRNTEENLNYSAARLMQVWPGRFPTLEEATPYARNPQALANRTYANRLGNGNEASGDGYRFRGRGLMQVTGRANYRTLGHEADPDALLTPQVAADTAAAFWENNGLNAMADGVLTRDGFNRISRRVNGGDHGSNERWQAYQRALTAFQLAPGPAATAPRLP